jgi:hypothetical protein
MRQFDPQKSRLKPYHTLEIHNGIAEKGEQFEFVHPVLANSNTHSRNCQIFGEVGSTMTRQLVCERSRGRPLYLFFCSLPAADRPTGHTHQISNQEIPGDTRSIFNFLLCSLSVLTIFGWYPCFMSRIWPIQSGPYIFNLPLAKVR